MKGDNEHLGNLDWALEFIASKDLQDDYDKWCRRRYKQETGITKDGEED